MFEEALENIITVRDFTQIFEAYAQFEESVLTATMEQSNGKAELEEELDLRMERLERLVDRRPLLLNDVLLRQNPNNVMEWMKRVELFKGNHNEVGRGCFERVGGGNVLESP